MRKKIVVDLNCLTEKSVSDIVIEKNGNYKKIQFSDYEMDLLLQSGYFDLLSKNNDLCIDVYEEDVTCKKETILSLIKDTGEFKNSNLHLSTTLNEIQDLLNMALETNSCVYFIL